jgi:flagellar protein FlgJ
MANCRSKSASEFVARITRAIEIAKQKGAALNAQAVMAQAALETGWGRSIPAANGRCSNNLFGIKAGSSWTGPVVITETSEFINGQWIRTTARWRAYPSWNECLVDYARIIAARYPQALRHADAPHGTGDAEDWIRALVSGQYKWATDPNYVSKVIRVGSQLAQHGGPVWV